jgi:SAM-dependent methyltransferase
MSLGLVVKALVPNLRHACVLELSARGAFFHFLRRRANMVVGSEYVEGVPSGTTVNGTRVEDVQHLSFAAKSFDLCTSTEVFEHVADDRRAFSEMHRVLKPGGVLLFTVPINLNSETFDRATATDGRVFHASPPEFHHDPARGSSPVLCFRNYGRDITKRLLNAGFDRAEVIAVDGAPWFGHSRPVILARKQ